METKNITIGKICLFFGKFWKLVVAASVVLTLITGVWFLCDKCPRKDKIPTNGIANTDTIADAEQLLNVTLHEINLDIDVYIDGVFYKQEQSVNHSKGYHCVDVKTTIGLDESQYSSVRWTDASGALLSTNMWLDIANLQVSALYKCYLTTGTDRTRTINH